MKSGMASSSTFSSISSVLPLSPEITTSRSRSRPVCTLRFRPAGGEHYRIRGDKAVAESDAHGVTFRVPLEALVSRDVFPPSR
jgi:hypothetical protein